MTNKTIHEDVQASQENALSDLSGKNIVVESSHTWPKKVKCNKLRAAAQIKQFIKTAQNVF